MAMKRTQVDGKTLNHRTADMLALWQFNCLTDFYVVQGSYNAGGVTASAGTHDGGGALDLSVYGWTPNFKRHVVWEGRRCGFAAWYRPTIPGLWGEHIHAIAIGDPEASSGAKNQVREYYAGGDGLVGNRPDPGPRLRKIVAWPKVPHKSVSLLVAYRQFRAKHPKPRMTVKRIQWVLNERLGTHLVIDGVAGPNTREAYKHWERRMDAPRADGVPGVYSLRRLGHGRFHVGVFSYEKEMKSRQSKIVQKQHELDNPTFQ